MSTVDARISTKVGRLQVSEKTKLTIATSMRYGKGKVVGRTQRQFVALRRAMRTGKCSSKACRACEVSAQRPVRVFPSHLGRTFRLRKLCEQGAPASRARYSRSEYTDFGGLRADLGQWSRGAPQRGHGAPVRSTWGREVGMVWASQVGGVEAHRTGGRGQLGISENVAIEE